MLAEGFLRLLCYREERKFAAAASERSGCQTNAQCNDQKNLPPSHMKSEDLQAPPVETGLNLEAPDPSQARSLGVTPRAPGLLIPGFSPLSPVCVEDCSLLEHYPDLQVADPSRVPQNLPGGAAGLHDLSIQLLPEVYLQMEAQLEQHSNSALSIPDQGYLVMGASVNASSLDAPGSGLEPMTNSVLNGLLEKQLEEVYMQHLTDNLARCNSHLGHSLLHGLVPLPQPGCQSQGSYLMEDGLEEGAQSGNKISYLRTQNMNSSSSNFSSPVLRISEVEGPQEQ